MSLPETERGRTEAKDINAGDELQSLRTVCCNLHGKGNMNAIEIEQAISELAERPFDPKEFPFAFLEAFGNKETTIRRLRKGESNKSDLGGVLQTSNIHIAVCPIGEVTKTLAALKASPATAQGQGQVHSRDGWGDGRGRGPDVG
jgi:hypothetical protein